MGSEFPYSRLLVLQLRSIVLASAVLLLSGCDNKTPQEHLQSAKDSVAASEPRVAIIELKNAIQKEPSLGEARALLGHLHYQAGDLPSALKELERAIDLGVTDDVTKVTLLRTKNAMGRYSEVVGELEEQEQLTPEFAVTLAQAYLIAGDLQRARPLLEQGLHLPEGLFGMARLAQLENDLERAYGYVGQLTQQFPEQRDGWLFKGEIELTTGDAAAALSSFEAARGLPGGEIAAHLGVMRAHLLADDLAAAQVEADALISRAAEFPPAQYLKGLISFKQGELDSAEAALRVVQQYARDHLPTLYLMGAVKAQQGQLNQAEDNLRRYLAQDESNASVRKLLASIYNEQGKGEEVIEVLSPVVAQNSDPQMWAMLGAAQLRGGDMSAATEAFQQAVKLAPDMAPFRNQLALSLLSAGEDDQAVAQLSSAIELDGDQFQSDYILVMLKLRDGDLQGADAAVDQLIAKSGDVPIGYNMKGAIALAMENQADAKKAFQQALAVDPSYFPAAQNLARLAEREGDLDAAKQLYTTLTQAQEGNEAAALALVDIAVREGDLADALAQLDAAVARYPQSVRARLGRLRLLLAQGDLVEAERVAQAAYELAPEMPDILVLKAEVEFRAGDTSAAQATAAELQALMDQYKGNPNLLSSAGALQLRLGNLTLARTNLEQALAANQPPNLALVSMARLELAEGNASAAQQRLDQLVARGISGEELQLLQGDVLVASQQVDAAVEHFKQMAAQGSRTGTSRYSLAVLQQGDHQRAQSILRDWLKQYPDDRGMQVMLANAQIQSGEQAAARAEYEAMLPTDNPVVLNNLAWIYMTEGDARALEMARQANAAAPNNPDIEDTLGWILVNQGEVGEGLELLRSSVRARPDNASVHYHLAVAHEKFGDRQAARRALERALALGEFPEEGEASALLESL